MVTDLSIPQGTGTLTFVRIMGDEVDWPPVSGPSMIGSPANTEPWRMQPERSTERPEPNTDGGRLPSQEEDREGSVSARPAETPPPSTSALPMPRWLFNLIGHVVAGVSGLVLGYLILHFLRPESFPFPW